MYERLRTGPIECRDLHKIVRDDGRPLLPLDHWGHGCPFTLTELESRLGPNPLEADTDEFDMDDAYEDHGEDDDRKAALGLPTLATSVSDDKGDE